jgi:Skp family chaperone for outer membrane proteins
MKKSIIAIFGAGMLIYACGESKKEEEKKDTTPTVEKRDLKGLKIAFYSNDSVAKNFKFFKEQDALMKKKQISFQKEVERRTKELQDFVIRNEEKARGGLLSENEIMQIQQRAQQMEQQIMLYQQNEGGRLEEERGKKTEILMNKIKGFGKKFSEKNGIDLLFMDGELSQINYISPNMDVTTEFVNYLNENQAEIEAEFKKK